MGNFNVMLVLFLFFRNYKNNFWASFGWLSFGQYGHLNLEPLLSLMRDSCAMTWPQGIIMGGFSSVVCSFETGQTKIEWNWYDGGRGISTCILISGGHVGE